jgi:hypothetical protein
MHAAEAVKKIRPDRRDRADARRWYATREPCRCARRHLERCPQKPKGPSGGQDQRRAIKMVAGDAANNTNARTEPNSRTGSLINPSVTGGPKHAGPVLLATSE